jgi:hypothetical protein
MREKRIGLAVLAIGLVAIALAQRVAPVRTPPLYDGVVVTEPYRWLAPPPGQKGDPGSATGSEGLEHGNSPVIAIATPEQPPQAQIFATTGALVLPPGTTSIKLSITPVPPVALPADGHIVGNVYRIVVANQAGVPAPATASANATVVLRGPDPSVDSTIERFNGQTWAMIDTQDAGFPATYLAVVTDFGDFALVAPGVAASVAAPSSPASPPAGSPASPLVSTGPGPVAPDRRGEPPVVLFAALAALAILGAIGLASLRRREQRAVRRNRPGRPRRR